MSGGSSMPPGTQSPLLAVNGLSISLESASSGSRLIVDGADFSIAAGEVVALVGESGSGKTMIARALLGLLPPGMRVTTGVASFEGMDLLRLPAAELRKVRGARIGMVFQEPMVSLNPALRIGGQMAEAMRLHGRGTEEEIRARSVEMLHRVRMTDPAGCLKHFPHEFSGGMRQRILLASVLMLRPALLIADEPTTALDKLVQKEVLDLMRELTHEQGTAVLLITHDVSLVAQYADQIVVLQHGNVRETGRAVEVLAQPRHAYTQKLLSAVPLVKDAHGPAESHGQELLRVDRLAVSYANRTRRQGPPRQVVKDVSLAVNEGEIVALVGESGCGKTTLCRALLGLLPATAGQIWFAGKSLPVTAGVSVRTAMAARDGMQMVFQDPFSSLDPRMSIEAIVEQGLGPRRLDRAERAERVESVLSDVGLDQPFWQRRPHELSGGQRQRVAIARALVRRPRLLIADEPVSALDLTIQAQIIDLLRNLRERYRFGCLFISHDLPLVRSLVDRVLVMYAGEVVESGAAAQVFDHPRAQYTRTLLDAAPALVPTSTGGFRLPESTVHA